MRMKNSGGGGERVQEVQGGHMVRSTGQKDRHSKVFTAKGPRDRRVRLSAHTAIEFYDVQDRLGYDRPSKAIDWLMNNAKNAIDKLSEVPPPNPIDAAAAAGGGGGGGGSSDMTILGHQTESSSGYAFQGKNQLGENPGGNSSFQTQSMGTPMNFQEYPHGSMVRTRVQTQDLCLSLHPSTDPTLFHGLAPATFGENYPAPPWDGGGTGENREGYMYSSRPFLGQSSMVSQSGTLQSSFSPPVDGWNHHQIQQSSSISGGLFSSQSLLQFQIPQQSHSSNEPSSASTNSYH